MHLLHEAHAPALHVSQMHARLTADICLLLHALYQKDPVGLPLLPCPLFSRACCRQVTLVSFLAGMHNLVGRNPAVFLSAVAHTCIIEGLRTDADPVIRLKTAQEQEDKAAGAGGRGGSGGGASDGGAEGGSKAGSEAGGTTAAEGAKPTPGDKKTGAASSAAAPTPGKTPGKGSGHKSSKKLVPASFAEVTDVLLGQILSYTGPAAESKQAAGSQQPTDMETEGSGPAPAPAAPAASAGAAAGAAGTPAAPEGSGETAALPIDLLMQKCEPLRREETQQLMALRMLADFCLLYTNTVGLMLKRDLEVGPYDAQLPQHHHHHAAGSSGAAAGAATTPAPARRSSRLGAATPGAGGGSSGGAAAADASCVAGGIIKRLMHVHLVCQLGSTRGMAGMAPGGGMGTLSSAASQLLQAICIRSSEGRKRVVSELVAVLNVGKAGSSSPPQTAAAATPARTPAGSKGKRSSSTGGAQAAGSGEGRSSSPPAVPVADALQTELALQPGPAPGEGPAAAHLGCYLQKPGCPPPAKVRQHHAH